MGRQLGKRERDSNGKVFPDSPLLFLGRNLPSLFRPAERTQGSLQVHRPRRPLLPLRSEIESRPLFLTIVLQLMK